MKAKISSNERLTPICYPVFSCFGTNMSKVGLMLLFFALFQFGLRAQSVEANVLRGADAQHLVPNSELVRIDPQTKLPIFISFSAALAPAHASLPTLVRQTFHVDASYDLQLIRSEKDQLGYEHFRYQQTYNGLPVEGIVLVAHVKDGKIASLNGDFVAAISLNTQPTHSEEASLKAALTSIGATKYAWELAVEQPDGPYQSFVSAPTATLTIVDKNICTKQFPEYHLAYKFDIYAVKPLSRAWVFVDAHTGEVVQKFDRIHQDDFTDTPVTVTTQYSGARVITTDNTGVAGANQFKLREDGRNIETRNLNNNKIFGDSNNDWTAAEMGSNKYAIDCHWATEKTYDYFLNTFQRNSFDNNGALITSYLNSNNAGEVNAFWDGTSLNYGSGDMDVSPLTTVDVVGHEFMHAVTEFTAGLIYANESGALNESYSDVFGAVMEFYAKPPFSTGNWTNAEDAGTIFRNMANPNEYEHPDTYDGLYWSDFADVHTTSGVQNFWFYLLTEGGTGTNDIGNQYSVTGIGIESAAAIAYRSLSVYLTPASNYEDARFYAIQAAHDLFPDCLGSEQVIAVANAWYAVGIGTDGSAMNINADNSGTFCFAPQTIQFDAEQGTSAIIAGTYSWDFGDGSPNSTLENPEHTYTTEGSFDVTLTAQTCDGNTLEIIKEAYIVIDFDAPCSYNMPPNAITQTICEGYLYDNGGPTGNYESSSFSTFTIVSPTDVPISLIFSSFEFDWFGDYLSIYDGMDENAPLIGAYTGNDLVFGDIIRSTGGSITIVQITDEFNEYSGFGLHWISDQDGDGVASLDCSGTDCDDTNPNAWTNCATCIDTDEDGFYTGTCDVFVFGEDCNDGDPSIYPTATELCNNNDDDCTGAEDNNPPIVTIAPNPTPVSCGSPVILDTNLPTNVTNNPVGGAVTIPDFGPGNPYPAIINVSGGSATGISVASVQLNGLSHAYPSDILIYLEAPNGVQVILMNSVGGSDNISNENYTIQDGAMPFDFFYNPSGTYAPADGYLLSNFTGSMNGAWKLYIEDFAGQDAGTLTSWGITFYVTISYDFDWAATPTNGTIPAVQNPSVTPITNTTYAVTITSSLGCVVTASADVVVNMNTFYADADGDNYGIDNDTQIDCYAPAGYTPNNGDCNDSNPTINPNATEILNTLDDNCNGVADEGLVATNDVPQTSKLFTLYPNPATTEVRVFLPNNNQIATATITDATGRTMFQQNIHRNDETISLTSLVSGVYFIRFQQGSITTTKKLIKL